MSHLIRILFALQISLVFVAGCVADEDVVDETELTSTDDADLAAEELSLETSSSSVPTLAFDGAADGVTTQALCTSYRLNSRATLATCRSVCSSRGQTALGFDNRTKICRCCSPGPL